MNETDKIDKTLQLNSYLYLYTEANKQINNLKEEIQLKDKTLLNTQKKIEDLQKCSDIHNNKDDFCYSQNEGIDLVYTSSNKLKDHILYDNLVAYSCKTSNYYISLTDLNKIKSSLLNRISELEKDKISTETELSILKSQNEKIQSQKLASTSLCKTLDDDYHQLKSNFEKYKLDMTESIKQTLKQSTTTIQKLKQENEKLKDQNLNLKTKYEILEKEQIEKNQQIEEIKTLKQKYENHTKINKRIIEKIIKELNTKLTKLVEENEELKKKNEDLEVEVTSYSNLIHVDEESGRLEISQTPMSDKSFSFNNYSASPSPSHNRVIPTVINTDNNNNNDVIISNNSFNDLFQIISPIRNRDSNDNYIMINYNGISSIVKDDIIDGYEQKITELENKIKEIEDKHEKINLEFEKVERIFSDSTMSRDSISRDSFSVDGIERSFSFSSPKPIKHLTIYEGNIVNCISEYYPNNNNEEENRKLNEIKKLYEGLLLSTNNSSNTSFNSSINTTTILKDEELDFDKPVFGVKVFDVITLKDNHTRSSPLKNRRVDVSQLLKRQAINQLKKNEEKNKDEEVDPTLCPLCKKKIAKKMICHLCKKNYCYDCCKNHVVIPGKNYKRFVCNTCNSNITQN